MGSTGQKAAESGVYRNDCNLSGHKREIALSKGETFPPCGGCTRSVTWILVRRTQ